MFLISSKGSSSSYPQTETELAPSPVDVSAFVYCHCSRKNYSIDEKTLRSDSSIRLFPREATSAGDRKTRNPLPPAPSLNVVGEKSEFFYLSPKKNEGGSPRSVQAFSSFATAFVTHLTFFTGERIEQPSNYTTFSEEALRDSRLVDTNC
ncbi:hypothetical protein RJT34_29716 [Clitoria ternatea]|uniref:Uncharacterized protein n=1 Tax=Clitoria ternatea TaxID=43366 RepID=A0AAN9EVS1_CLITE